MTKEIKEYAISCYPCLSEENTNNPLAMEERQKPKNKNRKKSPH